MGQILFDMASIRNTTNAKYITEYGGHHTSSILHSPISEFSSTTLIAQLTLIGLFSKCHWMSGAGCPLMMHSSIARVPSLTWMSCRGFCTSGGSLRAFRCFAKSAGLLTKTLGHFGFTFGGGGGGGSGSGSGSGSGTGRLEYACVIQLIYRTIN